jgi:hypothetical protein
MKFLIVALLFCSASLFCQTTPASSGPTVPKLPDVNSEILQLVIQDQWDRGNDMFGNEPLKTSQALNWKLISERDEQRHTQVHKLLAEGKIKTGREYYYVALIFQHSVKAEDLMFAHVLAMTSVSKGYFPSRWLAAATLDRYLQTIKQPQVFGTQFFRPSKDTNWTMEPYDHNVLSDDERALWCVIPLAEQEKLLKDMQNGGTSASTNIDDCK